MQKAIDPLIQAELDEHPELSGHDNDSRNGSTAPTTNTGTPIPSAPSRIKLNLSKPRIANGGSSGVQSDDDDDE